MTGRLSVTSKQSCHWYAAINPTEPVPSPHNGGSLLPCGNINMATVQCGQNGIQGTCSFDGTVPTRAPERIEPASQGHVERNQTGGAINIAEHLEVGLAAREATPI